MVQLFLSYKKNLGEKMKPQFLIFVFILIFFKIFSVFELLFLPILVLDGGLRMVLVVFSVKDAVWTFSINLP